MTFHALSTQKFRYSVDLSLGKTPDVVTGHTGLHDFFLLLAKKKKKERDKFSQLTETITEVK